MYRDHYFINLQRINIGERCVNSINHFLELIAKEVKDRLGILCSNRMTLDDQLAPARGSAYYMQVGRSWLSTVIDEYLFVFGSLMLIKARRQLVMYLNSW